MGYRPPPPPGGWTLHRSVRQFLRNVPGPDSALWLLGGPGKRAKVGVEMEVLPYKHKWEWRVSLTFNKHPSLTTSTVGTWRHPAPHEVRGRCRNQGDAWIKARSVADTVRARLAEVENVQMQRHTEHVPL